MMKGNMLYLIVVKWNILDEVSAVNKYLSDELSLKNDVTKVRT